MINVLKQKTVVAVGGETDDGHTLVYICERSAIPAMIDEIQRQSKESFLGADSMSSAKPVLTEEEAQDLIQELASKQSGHSSSIPLA